MPEDPEIVGRKPIIDFLRMFMDLKPSSSEKHKWQKVKRWEKQYGLPLDRHVNGKPYIDPEKFSSWWDEFRTKKNEGSLRVF